MASDAYLQHVTRLAMVVPVTRTDRDWPNDVRLGGTEIGLAADSFAMTEQLKTIDRARIEKIAGRVDTDTQDAIVGWLRDFLGPRG